MSFMAEDVPPPVDFWTVLDEAQTTVETWPAWQQRVEADVYYERGDRAAKTPPGILRVSGSLTDSE